MPDTLAPSLPSVVSGRRALWNPDGDSIKFSVANLQPGRAILVTKAYYACPLRDHPVCANAHFRSGLEFEHERRCPQHEFSWEPEAWQILVIDNPPAIDPKAEVLTSALLPAGTREVDVLLANAERVWFTLEGDRVRMQRVVHALRTVAVS